MQVLAQSMSDNLARAQGPSLFVGIDAGTSFSGFATAAMGSNIRFQSSYPFQHNDYCKNKSLLLYQITSDMDWRPVAWGWDAYRRHKRLQASERQGYLLIDR